jgi:hypothetical protein
MPYSTLPSSTLTSSLSLSLFSIWHPIRTYFISLCVVDNYHGADDDDSDDEVEEGDGKNEHVAAF